MRSRLSWASWSKNIHPMRFSTSLPFNPGLSRRVTVTFAMACVALLTLPVTIAQDSALKPFVPRNVEPPKDAKYVLADGSVYIAGNDLLVPYILKLNAVFLKTHPGFKFKTDLYTSGLAVSGISSGKSAIGPMARDPSSQTTDPFFSLYAYPPPL